MPPKKSNPFPRFRVGKVSVYEHLGAWWVHYRDDAGPHRKKVPASRDQAEQVAARVNSQLASNEPTLLTFTPVGVAELRKQLLEYHEHVLQSSVGTLRRYRSATRHLEDFVGTLPKLPQAHEVKVEAFAAYLRRVMAGFFLVVSFFKLLNPRAFADAYAGYDVVAARWRAWGYAYPIVELALGAAYLTGFVPLGTNVVTLVVMGVGTVGVVRSLLARRKIRGACLGTVFNLPMSYVTLTEHLLMGGMAAVMLAGVPAAGH